MFALIDTRTDEKSEYNIKTKCKGRVFFNHGTSNSKGIILVVHQRLTDLKITQEIIHQGQLSKFSYKIDNRQYNLIITYGPSNKDDHKFFSQELFTYEMLPATDYNIICGDFNAVQDQYLDCRNYSTHTTPKTTKVINDAKGDHDLLDPFRERYDVRKTFSWQKFQSDKHSRIDYFLISSNNFPHVATINYKEISHFITDHKQVNMDLIFNRIKRGRGYYKFNNNLLTDKKYADVSNRAIAEHFINNSTEPHKVDPNLDPLMHQFLEQNINPALSTESLMCTLTGEAMKRTYELRKEKTIHIRILESRIKNTVEILENSNTVDNTDTLDTLSRLRSELNEIREEEYNTRVQDLKVANLFSEEKPSKELNDKIYRPRTQASYSQIYQEREGEEPVLLTEQSDVELEFNNHFREQYKYKVCNDTEDDIKSFVNTNDLKKVTNEQNKAMSGRITVEEATSYLKTLSNNKAPGRTGFTTAFYKFFWPRIRNLITRAINYCFEIKQIQSTQTLGIICLIPKADKSPYYIGNLRPITLLSTFYKIISGILTQRIKPVLESLIGSWQKAYLPDRYIGDATRNTYDIFSYAKNNNLPGILLLIDFSKAFDSISYNYILSTLRIYGFCNYIISWIELLLRNFRSVTVLNGNIGKEIELGRGCRQGDPISGYLFIIAVEILIIALQNNHNIQPYTTRDGLKHLTDIYADDLTIFLKNLRTKGRNIAQFNEIIKTLKRFESLSGLAVNLSKTKISPFGKKLNLYYLKDELKLDIVDSFRLLGCTFDPTLENIAENFTKAISAMRKELYAWSTIKLSVRGKINIVKTYGISKLNHLAIILPTLNKTHITEIENIVYKFVNPGRAIYSKDLIFRPIKDLGLGLQNINNFWRALKISWFRRTYYSNSFWLKLLNENTKCKNINSIMQSSSSELRKIFMDYNNPFWTQAFNALELCSNYLQKNDPTSHLSTNILYNDQITPTISFEHRELDFIGLESLLKIDKNFHSFEHINIKFPKLFQSCLGLNSFIAASSRYKNFHTNNAQDFIPPQTLPTIDHLTSFLTKKRKGCKFFYKTLTKCTTFSEKLWADPKKKWEQKLEIVINQDDWNNSIQNCLLTRYSNTLMDLNLQILRNNIITNDRLHKMKKTDSNTCEFCPLLDNTLHRIYKCTYSKKIWLTLDEIFAIIGIYTFTDIKQCLLGDPDRGPNTVFNYLIYNTKLYINNCHIHKNKPTPAPYIWYVAKIANTLTDRRVVDKIIDNKNWKLLSNYFNNDANS